MIDEDVAPILLDTNVVSELARPSPEPRVVEELRRVTHRTYLPVIVLGELQLGIELLPVGRRRAELQRYVDILQDAYLSRMIPFGAKAAVHYARSVGELSRRGVTMGVNDAYIAACAVTHTAVLYTRNVKDFMSYPGLVVRSPWDIGES